MVLPAPRIDTVLPSLLEFIGAAVVVGHNIRFDVSFLQAALLRAGRPRLTNQTLDTCALARRLVRDEVRDCKLATLAERFRVATRPNHRALPDVLATAEVLHCLLERAGTLGVTALDDLLALPTVVGHPETSKLRLVARLPRSPGVYLMRDRGGRVLYVGKAVDIRRRVRSYFGNDERRKVGQLLRELESIDAVVCRSELEAAVLEVRLIHELLPRFNRQSKLWRRYAYLKLTQHERFPRLSVVKEPKPDGCLYLGPLSSAGKARDVADAVESAVPIRRCTKPVSARSLRAAPCAPAQLGVSTCPCAGQVGEAEYAAIVDRVVTGLREDPSLLLAPLESRMRSLAAARRFEEAASVRDRAGALARAVVRQRRLERLRASGRVVLDLDEGGRVTLDRGLLVGAWAGASTSALAPASGDGPLPKHLADELLTVAAWLDKRAGSYRVVSADADPLAPFGAVPTFTPLDRARSA